MSIIHFFAGFIAISCVYVMTRQNKRALSIWLNVCLSSHSLDRVTPWGPAVGSVSAQHAQQEAEARPAGSAFSISLLVVVFSLTTAFGETINAIP